jgi:hypothetical protein
VRAFYQVWTRKIRRVIAMLHRPLRFIKRFWKASRFFMAAALKAVRIVPLEHFARPSRRGY